MRAAKYQNVREYVEGWREIRRLPDALIVHNWHGDPWWPVSIRDLKVKMRRDMHKRINQRAGVKPVGNKDDDHYFDACLRDQWALRDRVTKRYPVYCFLTKEARRRFAHLLDSREDN